MTLPLYCVASPDSQACRRLGRISWVGYWAARAATALQELGPRSSRDGPGMETTCRHQGVYGFLFECVVGTPVQPGLPDVRQGRRLGQDGHWLLLLYCEGRPRHGHDMHVAGPVQVCCIGILGMLSRPGLPEVRQEPLMGVYMLYITRPWDAQTLGPSMRTLPRGRLRLRQSPFGLGAVGRR